LALDEKLGFSFMMAFRNQTAHFISYDNYRSSDVKRIMVSFEKDDILNANVGLL
jgi:hypothetical protein